MFCTALVFVFVDGHAISSYAARNSDNCQTSSQASHEVTRHRTLSLLHPVCPNSKLDSCYNAISDDGDLN